MASDQTHGESSSAPAMLGILHIAEDGPEHERATLMIQDPAASSSHTLYKLKPIELSSDPSTRINVFSHQMLKPGTSAMPKVEGVVTQRYDLALPLQNIDAGGGRIVLDPKYEEMARQRTEQASIRSRTVQPYTRTRDDTIQRLGVARNLVKAQTARTKAMQVQTKVDRARARMDKSELETLLYSFFQRQAQWSFKQLQLSTEQPAAWLKEVLAGIATQSKRGPNKDLYELQKSLKA